MRKGIFTMAFVAALGAGALVGCDDDGDSKVDGGGGKGGAIVIPDGGGAGTGGGAGGTFAGTGGGLDGGTAGAGGNPAGDGGVPDGGTTPIVCEPGTAATNTAALNSTAPATTESVDKTSTLPGPAYPALPAL